MMPAGGSAGHRGPYNTAAQEALHMSRRLAVAFAVAADSRARAGRHARRIRGHVVREPRRADDPERHHQVGDADAGGPVHAARRAAQSRRQAQRGPAPMTLPAFCRVEATARPTSDSDIKFEVWIPPAEAWNGKFQGVGNGGYSGAIGYAAMATGLRRGYAIASTDTGHTGDDMKFGQGHPEKVIDWAYRRVHVMTETSKLIVRDAQGRFAEHVVLRRLLRPAATRRSPKRSAIPRTTTASVAGDPANNRIRQTFAFLHSWIATHDKDGKPIIPQSKLRAAHQGGRRGLRRPRRTEGRPHRRSAPLPLRSGEAALQGAATSRPA